jgi:hypothetical protein
MFFPERVKSILLTDKVLEIGPGAMPHPRANAFLEKVFSPEEALVQSGYAKPAKLEKETFFYDGTRFPFEDNEFDYIICSHVIEHVPSGELPSFISEMQRVAKKGYIEFPTVFYEIVNYEPVHIWLMNLRGDKMIFMDKKIFVSNNVHKIIRKLFYSNDNYLRNSFKRYKELFFAGYEWNEKISYEFVDNYDSLVNDKDIEHWEQVFSEFKIPSHPVVAPPIYRRIFNKIKRIFAQ